MEHEIRWAQERFEEVLQSGHWLGNYINSLLEDHDTSEISFEKAEQFLSTERREFDKDLAIARRMYRVYPQLVLTDQHRETVAERGGEGHPQAQGQTVS